jgi:N-acetyl-gamma-glutamyl-phosphate reductase uncommon form
MHKIFVDGLAGTTGLRILSRINDRSDLSLVDIDPLKRKDIETRLECMREADITILCLPDEASREIVAAADKTNDRFRIIDASTEFRTSAGWVYGLPELEQQTDRSKCSGHQEVDNKPEMQKEHFRPTDKPQKSGLGENNNKPEIQKEVYRPTGKPQKSDLQENDNKFETQKEHYRQTARSQSTGYQAIADADRVSVPGCHATGFNLIAGALIRLGLTGGDYPYTCQSVTGYSGGGKKMIEDYTERDLAAPRQYGLSQQHKHLPEMIKVSGAKTVIFNPLVSAYYSGMLVTVPIHAELLGRKIGLDGLYEVFSEYFDGRPLIKVIKPGLESLDGFLSADKMSGRDDLELLFYGSEDRLVISAVYDNLGKGASGAAIQCMNIMLGLPETEGLVI